MKVVACLTSNALYKVLYLISILMKHTLMRNLAIVSGLISCMYVAWSQMPACLAASLMVYCIIIYNILINVIMLYT